MVERDDIAQLGQSEGSQLAQTGSTQPELADDTQSHEGKKRFIRWTDKSIKTCVAGAIFITLSILILFIAGEVKVALLAFVLSFILFFYAFLKQIIRDVLAESATKKDSDWTGLHVYAGLDVMESMKFLFMGLLMLVVSVGLCVFRFVGH